MIRIIDQEAAWIVSIRPYSGSFYRNLAFTTGKSPRSENQIPGGGFPLSYFSIIDISLCQLIALPSRSPGPAEPSGVSVCVHVCGFVHVCVSEDVCTFCVCGHMCRRRVCVCVCVRTCGTSTGTCPCARLQLCAHVHVCVCRCAHVCMRVSAGVRTCACVCLQVCARVHACVCRCVHVCLCRCAHVCLLESMMCLAL